MTQTISNQKIEEFLSSKGKFLLYAILGLGILVFTFYRFFAPSSNVLLKQYLDAKVHVQTLMLQKDSNEQVLKELQSSPLAKDNEGIIAQNLAFQGRWDEVYPIAEKNMEKFLTKDSPYYNYSAVSLLIEKKQVQQAIKQSIDLQNQIESDASLALLSVYNFVRLNILSKYASLEDKQTISFLNEKFKSNPNNSQYMNLVEELFKEGNSNLNDFLKTVENS